MSNVIVGCGLAVLVRSGDPVNPLPSLHLLGGDRQPEPPLQGAGERAANRVRLPASGRDDLGDGDALRVAAWRRTPTGLVPSRALLRSGAGRLTEVPSSVPALSGTRTRQVSLCSPLP